MLDGLRGSLPSSFKDRPRAHVFVIRNGHLNYRFHFQLLSRGGVGGGFHLLGHDGQVLLVKPKNALCIKNKEEFSKHTHIQEIRKGDTNVCLKTCRAVLMLYQGGNVKHHLEVGKEEARLLFSLG